MKSIAIRYEKEEDLESVRPSVVAYPPERVLIQVYDCVSDFDSSIRLRDALRDLFPGCSIIGANASGGIIDGRILDGAVIINFSLFDNATIRTVLVPQNQDMAKAASETAAKLASPNLKAVITFGCGIQNQAYLDNGLYLQELSDELMGIPIAGGLAGAGVPGSFSSYVFTEKGSTSFGFAAASISGSRIRVLSDFDIDWIPVGKKLTITNLIGKRVYTIDDRPVTELYRDYLGINSDQITVDHINRFPLMMNRQGFALTDLVSRVYEDGSVDFIQQLNHGEQVQFGICAAHLQEDGVRRINRSLRSFSPDGVFCFACGSRKFILGQNSDVDMAILGGMTSSCGMYTFGEFFIANSIVSLFFHQALTVLALAESENSPEPVSTEPIMSISAQTVTFDNYVQVKALMHLVMSITKELENKNNQLNELAHSDGLTGLGNRRKFDEHLDWVIKTNARSETPFALLMLDVDYFKMFNDLYGHVAGDDCLRSLGRVLRDVLQRAGDYAFRYGGEEFACILSPSNMIEAAGIAERIRSQIEALGISHKKSPEYGRVTVSIGVLLVHADKQTIASDIIQQSDTLLYSAKKQGRNRTIFRDDNQVD